MAGNTYAGIEKFIFADVYNFFLKYQNMDGASYNWEVCLQDAKNLCFKYREHPLAKKMAFAVIDQLQHKVGGELINGLSHEQWEKLLQIEHKTGW